MQDYRSLIVWQKSHQLTLMIYKLTDAFPKEEKFGLVSQIRRSSSSVAINIVEGCGRTTQKDKANFFQTSYASAQETEYILLLSKDLGFIPESLYNEVLEKIVEVKSMMSSLIKKVKAIINEG